MEIITNSLQNIKQGTLPQLKSGPKRNLGSYLMPCISSETLSLDSIHIA